MLFTLHGWDPHSEPLAGWLADRLTRDYAFLRAREYGRDAAARLISGDYIAVILDGLDGVLPAAYTHRLGHQPPAYTLDQAQRWLGHLAHHMNAEGTRDLAWWQIPRWVPAWPRVLATVVACELVVGLVIGSGVGFTRAVVSEFGLTFTIGSERSGFTGTLVSKLGLALTIGLVIGFMGAFGERPLASAQLWRRGKAPALLLRFLEDARKRQVLRTVGQVYQFRHAQLQDRLASAYSPRVRSFAVSVPGVQPKYGSDRDTSETGH
ncbi:MAG: hypothetical protein ACRDQ4_21420 [Pseudonocardiaceae bacterium]